jgi:hypothetical protein
MKQAPPVVTRPREITGDPPAGELIERSRREPELFALTPQSGAVPGRW